jgi:arginyl-tRNA synthetase
MNPPYVTAEELNRYEQGLTAETLAPLFASLSEERDKGILKSLLLHLDSFEDVVKDAARLRAPHFITQYCLDVAANFHSFYTVCRILTPEPELTRTRLMLIQAIRKILAQALELLGVSAPEKM